MLALPPNVAISRGFDASVTSATVSGKTRFERTSFVTVSRSGRSHGPVTGHVEEFGSVDGEAEGASRLVTGAR